jgi:hypothetical protein
VILAWPMSGEVCGGLVAHDLGADLELLYGGLVHLNLCHCDRVSTFRSTRSFALGVGIFAVLRSSLVVLAGCDFPELF